MADFDYSKTSLDIQSAMLDLATRYPDKNRRPDSIRWGEYEVRTVDLWGVPAKGKITIQFLESNSEARQGIDIKTNGSLILVDGEEISHLRTWHDADLEDTVEYQYNCPDGQLLVWNVFERTWPNGEKMEEKWTGNSGFYIEKLNDCERIYHCSHGLCFPPDFESLVVRVKLT